jgi:hypothetical protein
LRDTVKLTQPGAKASDGTQITASEFKKLPGDIEAPNLHEIEESELKPEPKTVTLAPPSIEPALG